MKPETKTEITLTNWLRKNKIFVLNNRKIKELKENYVFTTKGLTNKKPDMVIFTPNGYYAIEIKPGGKASTVRKSNKIIEYQKEYETKQTTYYNYKQEQINIKGFLIATENSIKGYLYTDEQLEQANEKKWLQLKNKYNKIFYPRVEGVKTKEFIRILKDNYSELTKNIEPRNNFFSSIGMLTTADVDLTEPKPAIFGFQYNKLSIITLKQFFEVIK